VAYNGEVHTKSRNNIITARGSIVRMDNTVGSLTKFERSIIIGSLLGDGYMRIMPGRLNAFLEINHSIKARDYADYKYNSLKRICKSKPKERKSNDGRIAYRFFTKQHPELTKIYKQFYVNGRKTIPKIDLDPVILAVWYMDDGSKSRDCDIYLNSQQFSLKEQKRLLSRLREVGVKARLNKDKNYYRIRILKESISEFMKLIEPHIIDSMRYKLVMTP
jgi:hypothetical protein